MAHPNRLLSKQALLEAVWSGRYVNEGEVRHYIGELRRALADDLKAPRYIETVHGRGYRWIGEITVTGMPAPSSPEAHTIPSLTLLSSSLPRAPAASLLGREVELEQLHQWLEAMSAGRRQIVFISGEVGLGKTALAATFTQKAAAERNCRLAKGQCIEQYGREEPYLPILEALESLCQGPDNAPVLACLQRYAPNWLPQVPSLLDADTLAEVQRRTLGATPKRMLHELVQALEAMSTESSLILWLDDLHWADAATLSLIDCLARRSQPARLLLIGTYRPVVTLPPNHPLVGLCTELYLHGHCQELELPPLSEAAIVGCMKAHFAGLPVALAPVIHHHTGGNPLFLVNVVKHLQAQGKIVQTAGQWTVTGEIADLYLGIPDTLQALIQQQLSRLSADEQRLLAVASVAGAVFAAAALASALRLDIKTIEEHCAALARRKQFLRLVGQIKWPDGTLTAHYEFRHSLYQQMLYAWVTPNRRQYLHQLIGERLEQGYGTDSTLIAAELAWHFEQSHDHIRSMRYHQQTKEIARQRQAPEEAIAQ